MTERHARDQPLAGRSSMATRALLAALSQRLERDDLPRVEFTAGGGVKVAQAIRDGDACDVVVLADGAVRSLAAEGFVRPLTVRQLYRSPGVLGVPVGSDAEAATDRDSLIALLRSAARIGYSTGPSGTAFLGVIDSLGLHDEISDRLVRATPGTPVAQMVAQEIVTVGFQQASEMADVEGVRILGELPAPYAITSCFSGGVTTGSQRTAEALRVLDFLGDTANLGAVTEHAMTLATSTKG